MEEVQVAIFEKFIKNLQLKKKRIHVFFTPLR